MLWNLNLNLYISIKKNAFEIVIWETAAILSLSQYVNGYNLEPLIDWILACYIHHRRLTESHSPNKPAPLSASSYMKATQLTECNALAYITSDCCSLWCGGNINNVSTKYSVLCIMQYLEQSHQPYIMMSDHGKHIWNHQINFRKCVGPNLPAATFFQQILTWSALGLRNG